MPETNEPQDEVNNESTFEQQNAQLRAEIAAANADGKKSAQQETYDRSTVIAFGLLFVLPALVIVFSLLFLLPLIARTIQEEPSGATTLRSNSGAIDQK